LSADDVEVAGKEMQGLTFEEADDSSVAYEVAAAVLSSSIPEIDAHDGGMPRVGGIPDESKEPGVAGGVPDQESKASRWRRSCDNLRTDEGRVVGVRNLP